MYQKRLTIPSKMKFILILAITLAFTVVSANSIQNRELDSRGLVADLVERLLTCLIDLLKAAVDVSLKPILDKILELVRSLGICNNVNLDNGIVIVVIDLLRCLLGNLRYLNPIQITSVLSTLFRLEPVLIIIGVGDLRICLPNLLG
ncbi:hypothetical protein FQR65_LT11949 [Abscondita terminalis]|nr:hypothetical protein FQR65_LT11949 [Abscondita terminalis]